MKIHEEQCRHWTLMLHQEYRRLQEELSPLRSLDMPMIVVNESLKSCWGQWRSDNRQLVMAYRLLREFSWDKVLYVFKHEIAHQIVSELYGIEEEGHGPLFAKACGILKIPVEASVSFQKDTAKEKLLEKIDKLLSLGQSSNHHEAERALEKAQELALRHNIDLLAKEESEYSFRTIGPKKGRLPTYLMVVMHILQKHYCVKALMTRRKNDKGKAETQYEIYGLPQNLDLAEYVFDFLIHQGHVEWDAFKKIHGRDVSRDKKSFLQGMYSGFAEKLAEQEAVLEEKFDLIWQGDPALESFFKERNPSVRTVQRGAKIRPDVHAAGHKKGQSLQLKPGLKKGKASKGTQGYLR